MKTKEAIRLYCLLMEEVRVRLDIVNLTYQNNNNLPPAMVREICYLQFRFICEIIALACLVAHGDLPEVEALKDTYEPGKIIKRLEQVKPFFYPQPMDMVKNEELKQTILKGSCDRPHLTQQELPVLWGRAGDVLHRSPMVKVLSKKKKVPGDFADIFDWSSKIVGLVSTHWITLEENKKGIFVTLKAQETNRVAVSIYDFSKNLGEVQVSTTWLKD